MSPCVRVAVWMESFDWINTGGFSGGWENRYGHYWVNDGVHTNRDFSLPAQQPFALITRMHGFGDGEYCEFSVFSIPYYLMRPSQFCPTDL